MVGLIPFWTKRSPDYGSVMRTINARDDSLAQSGGMWNTMKHRKRCIVVAQGFYEWLKKNGGKEKIPHYTKRKDGQLMCFAGLWDCVQYEGLPQSNPFISKLIRSTGSEEKHYTYTIITTDSNKQLSFLHDRMPVILDNGSDKLKTWLDPGRTEWSKDLQSLLKPFDGELECYPVSKDVGKVGNNSPSFIVPVASTENKNNIANFFANPKKDLKADGEAFHIKAEEAKEIDGIEMNPGTEENRITVDQDGTENKAPIPTPLSPPTKIGSKRAHEVDAERDDVSPTKSMKVEAPRPQEAMSGSPEKRSTGKKNRSATSNGSKASPIKPGNGSQRITSFFNK